MAWTSAGGGGGAFLRHGVGVVTTVVTGAEQGLQTERLAQPLTASTTFVISKTNRRLLDGIYLLLEYVAPLALSLVCGAHVGDLSVSGSDARFRDDTSLPLIAERRRQSQGLRAEKHHSRQSGGCEC